MRGGGGGDPLRHHASNAVKDGASPGLSSYGTSDARQRQPQTGSEGVIVAELGHKVTSYDSSSSSSASITCVTGMANLAKGPLLH